MNELWHNFKILSSTVDTQKKEIGKGNTETRRSVFRIPYFPSSQKRPFQGVPAWCVGQDSNLGRLMPADLQSAPFDRFGTYARDHYHNYGK
jgi:hypothetical protein